jgi:hypothetical protein
MLMVSMAEFGIERSYLLILLAVCSDGKVLRRIFGPKRDEMTGDWRKLHIEELHNLYSSPNIIRMKKSRRIRRVGGEEECI